MRSVIAWSITIALPLVAMAGDMAVTVYNSNLGVVTETRLLAFDKGVNRLAFRDVPAQIDAASVRFDIPEGSGKVTILEQNYAYDLVSPEQLYNKYIDNEIELIDKDGRLYSGTLLAFGSNAVTLMDKSGRIKVVRLDNVTEVDFPSLPEGLITRPTLFWLYNSESSQSLKCQVSYQTAGLDWTAEYIGLLGPDEAKLDLSGWASITNNSGKTYKDATLKLVAGEINKAQPEAVPFRKGLAAAMVEQAGFEEKEFFEYHMYSLPRTATVADKEIKQISLFEPASTAVKKIYTYRPDRHPKNVEVTLEFVNAQAAGLGMPLPAGRVRVFKADTDGSLILLGEDRLNHTPRDEEVRLKVGNAFDVVGEEKLLDQRRISQQVEERQYEVEIRNRKTQDITVTIEKQLFGFWEILQSDLEYTKEDANTVTFALPVKAGEAKTFRYLVRFTNQ